MRPASRGTRSIFTNPSRKGSPVEYIEEAVRSQIWGRVFLFAPTGGGKSRAAFELGSRLFGGGLPMTYINTEVDRDKLYADRFKYALIDLSREAEFHPDLFVDALDLAEARNPGGVVIIDSVSHEWRGVLNLADRFGDWKTVRPLHNGFVERMTRLNAHLIVCCRAKMKYEVEMDERDGRSRQTVTTLGVGPTQDAELQYEFNLVGQLEVGTHDCTLSGHVDGLVDTVVNFSTDADEVAAKYTKWLAEGTPIEIPVAAGAEEVKALVQSLLSEGLAEEKVEAGLAAARREARGVLTPEYVATQYAKSQQRLERKKAANEKKNDGAAETAPKAEEPAGEAAAPAEPSEAPSAPEEAPDADAASDAQASLDENAAEAALAPGPGDVG